MRASTMLEHEEKYAVILAFDVKVRSSVADPGCLSRIQIFPSRVYIKELKYFNPKNEF
jgi:hypothetical protein